MFPKALLLAAVLFLPAISQAQVKLLRHPTYSKGRVAFSYLGDIWIANENGSGVERLTDNRARDQFPRFSPDGQWIAFSSDRQGNYDVYVIPATGGKPRQLTFHTADDNVVGWTPDGKKIVFSSMRGNGAFPSIPTLWEIPVEGGIETPIPTDWGSYASYSADGAKMAFTRHPAIWTRKHYRGSYAADLWVMDVAAKKFARLGGDGRGDEYKGNRMWPMYAAAGEIYFVSNELPNEKSIQFGGPEVMKSVNNIWKISDKGGKAIQVTHHTDGNLYFPSISADRKTIVYEDNFGLWKLDTATGKSSEIRIDVKTDAKENDVELVTLNSEAEGFHLSPSNRRAAVAVHGEIFTIATDHGEPQRVTETPWREGNPRWSPNGKWIAFISDRTGREEIWISDELGKTPKKLSDADCEKQSIVWAPDSKSLLWTGSDHTLRRVEIESGKEERLVSNDAGPVGTPQFSPDSKWISYSKDDKLLHSHIYVEELATGQEHKIESDQFMDARGAKWTPDGKKLLLLGGVGGGGSIASVSGPSSSQLYSVALTHIAKDPNDRDINTEAQAEAAAQEGPAGMRGGRGPGMAMGGGPGMGQGMGPGQGQGMGPAGMGGPGMAAPVNVKIEWDEIDRRITRVTRMPGFVLNVVPAPDSKSYLIVALGGGPADSDPSTPPMGGGPGMFLISEDGARVTRLNAPSAPDPASGAPAMRRGGQRSSSEPQFTRDGRGLYFLQGGAIYTMAVPAIPAADADGASSAAAAMARGGRVMRGIGIGVMPGGDASGATPKAAPRRINFTVRMEIDRSAERKQVFDEAWRIMKNRFYDPKMHGVNWAAAKDTYEPLLSDIADTEELHNVIMEMIGDMNASHTGISGGGRLPGQGQEQERISTRYPGFDLEPDAAGFYKVSYIYRKGPADHDYIKLAVGNYILAVNDREFKTTDNYWKLFNILPGRKFEFRVNSKPSLDGAWTVSIQPLSAGAQANLAYDRWVEDHKQMVSKLTDGQIGYLHIRAMDAPSLAKFQVELLENKDKKALIIDERFNGGGGIDQELLEILNQRKAYQTTRIRDSLVVQRPAQAFFAPMVVVQNERSASDAEMFPDGFRALGLGKLVGVPTSGQVIGTGSYTLLDGSTLRTPASAVYNTAGRNLENYGVPPDVWVDNTPADFLAGHDRQIEKAIETLKSEMK